MAEHRDPSGSDETQSARRAEEKLRRIVRLLGKVAARSLNGPRSEQATATGRVGPGDFSGDDDG
ncbi:MAG: hypothetical protein AAF709_06770 [Pseudomonadota bacterium]